MPAEPVLEPLLHADKMPPKKAAAGKAIEATGPPSPKRFKLPGPRVPLTSPHGKKQGQNNTSRFWNKACRFGKAGANGQEIGALTHNWLVCFVPANKADNERAKETINAIGLRENSRWMDELKCYIMRSQSPTHSER